VEVTDDRVQTLSEMYKPRKTTYAVIELIDFVGLTQGSARDGLFSSSSMGSIKNADAIALVVSNFRDDLMKNVTPLKDVEQLDEELLISDLIIAENRLERIEKAYRRGKATNLLKVEEKLLHRIIDHLSNNRPIRDLKLDGEHEKIIRGFQFLTQKPMMVKFAGKFEMELAQLSDQDDIELFMQDMGIRKSARDRLCSAAYELLGFISFFTVGTDEVRAWSIQEGESILAAAGTIHSDLARGFIRAECISYNDLMAYGSEKQVSEKGLLRLEGRKYVVEDGNILNIRFNV
jgi:ribosome-binding ATPase YchF (GTP1/OBG family)